MAAAGLQGPPADCSSRAGICLCDSFCGVGVAWPEARRSGAGQQADQFVQQGVHLLEAL